MRQDNFDETIKPLISAVRAANLTYLDEMALSDLASAVRDVENSRHPGEILELGSALGGSAIVMAGAKAKDRSLVLHDVFEMIPPPSDRDGYDVQQRYAEIVSGTSAGIAGDTYYGYQSDLASVVSQNLLRFGFDQFDNIRLQAGRFEETLSPSAPVALAHIDCDWYSSVKTCLVRIDPWMSPGSIFVIDDYDAWSGCREAVDEFLSERGGAYERVQRNRLWLIRI